MKSRGGAPGPPCAGRGPGHPLHLVLGLTLWLAWFGATYGGVAVACAVVPAPAGVGALNAVNAWVLALAAAGTVAFGAAAWISLRAAQRLPAGGAGAGPRFIARAAAALYAVAAVSTAVVAMPALLLGACA